MHRLMLLRHSKTESDAPSGQDWDRRLDARGRKDAVMVGEWLAGQAALRPDLVLVSTAVRARETWDLVRQGMTATPEPLVVFLPEIYGAEPAHLLAIVRAASTENPERLMIVGHNPGLHEIALALIGSGDDAGRRALDDNLPTSGLVVIDFADGGWDDVSFRRGRLERFVSPRLLKEA